MTQFLQQILEQAYYNRNNTLKMQQQQTNPVFKDQQIINHLQSSKNRNCFVFPNSPIVIDSCFPSGNLGEVKMLSENTFQIRGNSDIQNDPFSKYWFYFRVRKVPVNMKIKFILRDLNSLRKLANKEKDRRMRPYIVYNNGDKWRPLFPQFVTTVSIGQFKNQKIERIGAEFTIKFKGINITQTNQRSKNKKQKSANSLQSKEYYFALNYPYTINDQNSMIRKYQNKAQAADSIYFNNEVLCQSVQGRNVNLLTITSISNIQDFQEKQPVFHPKLFPNNSTRPLKLKQQVPVIIITGRVHPSQVSSSFFVEGLVKFLCEQNNEGSKLLRQMFVFYIIPMLNPDGVQNGNFRFDNQSRNLNRFYGFSDFQQTPTIRAVQEIFIYLNGSSKKNQRRRVALYFDIHGHNSPKPSFIFGNHTSNLAHATENRLFCKLLQFAAPKGAFSYSDCQFSQGNMKMKQKYDHYSKQGSGRVFVGKKVGKVIQQRERQDFNSQSDQHQQQENKNKVENENTQKVNIQHSYTLEICPYYSAIAVRKSKNQKQQKNQSKTSFCSQSKSQLPHYCQQLARALCLVVLQILNVNPVSFSSNFGKNQSIQSMRENLYCQLQRSQKIKNRASMPLPKNSQKTSQQSKQKSVQNTIRVSQNILSNSKQQGKNQTGSADCDVNQLIDQQYFEKWFSNMDYIMCLQKKNFKWRSQKLKKFIQKAKTYITKRQHLKIANAKKLEQTKYSRIERSYTQVQNIEQQSEQEILEFSDRKKEPKKQANIFQVRKSKNVKRLNTIEGIVNQNSSQDYSEQSQDYQDESAFDKRTIKKTLRKQYLSIKKRMNGNLKQVILNPDFQNLDRTRLSVSKEEQMADIFATKFKTQKMYVQLKRANNINSGLSQNKIQQNQYNQQKKQIEKVSQRNQKLLTKANKQYAEVKQQKYPYLQNSFKKKHNQQYQKNSSTKRAEIQQKMMYYQGAIEESSCLKQIVAKMKNMQKIKANNLVRPNVATQQIWKRNPTEGNNVAELDGNSIFRVKLHNRIFSGQFQQQSAKENTQEDGRKANKQQKFNELKNEKQFQKEAIKKIKNLQTKLTSKLQENQRQQEPKQKKQIRQLSLKGKKQVRKQKIETNNFSRDRLVQLKRMNRLLQLQEAKQKSKKIKL